MRDLTYLVESGSIAVTQRDFICFHSNVEWQNLRGILSVAHVSSVPPKWGNETLLLLLCHLAQDFKMQGCSSQRFWMDDILALPYIEWDSCSYFAHLNAIGQFPLVWFNKASIVFEERAFPIAMSHSLILGNRGYVSNRELFPPIIPEFPYLVIFLFLLS